MLRYYFIKVRKKENRLNSLVDSSLRWIVRGLPLPPLLGTFEASKVCNLKCGYCRRWQDSSPSKLNKEQKFFTLYEMREVLKSIPSLREIGWMEDGEPLLNPEFNDIIGYVNSSKRVSTFTTNGTLVTEKLVNFWKTHGVKKIVISLDSPYPDKYESMRIGASFSKVMESCRLISKSGVLLQLNIVMFQEIVKDIPDFIELSGKLGARRVYLIKPHFINSIKNLGYTHPLTTPENFVILKKAQLKAKGYHITWTLPWFPGPYFRRCMFPFLSFYMEIGGNTQACCFTQGSVREELYEGEAYTFDPSPYSMVNALTGDFRRSWYGLKYKELRKGLIKSELPVGYKNNASSLVSLRRQNLKGLEQCKACLWRWGEAC